METLPLRSTRWYSFERRTRSCWPLRPTAPRPAAGSMTALLTLSTLSCCSLPQSSTTFTKHVSPTPPASASQRLSLIPRSPSLDALSLLYVASRSLLGPFSSKPYLYRVRGSFTSGLGSSGSFSGSLPCSLAILSTPFSFLFFCSFCSCLNSRYCHTNSGQVW